MKSIQVFNNEDFGQVRALAIENEPWFVAKDVCDALGLSNHRSSIALLDEDERGVHTVDTPSGTQQMATVSEAGLYSLILRSRKPEAKRFKRWVTHEVLPAIRQDGAYVAATPEESDDVIMARALLAAQRTIERTKRQIAGLTEDNARMLPKAVAYDSIIDTDGTMTVTEAARYLTQSGTKMSVRRLYALLRSDELVCKRGNAPTRKAIDQGLAIQVMSTRPDGKANDPYARLTQKGFDWCMTHYAQMPSQMRA